MITMRIADPSLEAGWQWLPMNPEVTGEVVNFLHLCPNGVRSMSKDFGGIVESSQNVAVLYTQEQDWYCRISMRSNRGVLLSNMLDRIRIMAEMSGMSCTKGSEYPAWDYKKESRLRDQMYRFFQRMYERDPEIRVLHAGLQECGIFASKIPDMDMVSIGPDMENVHFPKERLRISSVQRVWEFLVRFLENRQHRIKNARCENSFTTRILMPRFLLYQKLLYRFRKILWITTHTNHEVHVHLGSYQFYLMYKFLNVSHMSICVFQQTINIDRAYIIILR